MLVLSHESAATTIRPPERTSTNADIIITWWLLLDIDLSFFWFVLRLGKPDI